MNTLRTDTGFPCSGCGACCRIAGLWGHPSTDGLRCVHLVDTFDTNGRRVSACSVYSTRPDVCRFGFKKPPGQSIASYAQEVADGCNELQRQQGVPDSYRVTLR